MMMICIPPIPCRRSFLWYIVLVSVFTLRTGQKAVPDIVKDTRSKISVTMPEDELLLEANKWELSHGGLTGRTAQQFIDYLCGRGMKKQIDCELGKGERYGSHDICSH